MSFGAALTGAGRRARLALTVCLAAVLLGTIGAASSGPLWPVVASGAGAVGLIFGVAAWAFWGEARNEMAIERQAEAAGEKGLVAFWSYPEKEWRAYAATVWEVEEGGGFRIGAWIATPLGALFGGIGALGFRDNIASMAACVLGGAALAFGFVRLLRGVNRLFALSEVHVPTLRVNDETVRFRGSEWCLSKPECYLCGVELHGALLTLTFTDTDSLQEEEVCILVPSTHRDDIESLYSFLRARVSENAHRFAEEDEAE
jgi:hypothetical protein